MTRRGWTWALGLVACGTLLPACTHTVPGVIGHAAPMGADGAGGTPGGSPYNRNSSDEEKSAARPATLAATPPKPDVKLVAKSNADHRDTLTPPIDPTPADGVPSAKLTTVAAAPKGTVTGALGTDILPASSNTVPKDTVVARLPALAPAGDHHAQSKPDQLPAVISTRVASTVRPSDNLSAGTPAPAPMAPTPPLVEAMRYFLDNRPGEAMLCLKGYDKDNQELLLLLLPLAARLAEGKLTARNAQDTMYFYDQLNSMLVDLRPRLNLVIDKICFCRDIRGFGMYRPKRHDPPTYSRGDRMDIYVEVRNFSSTRQVGDSGRTIYVTRLRTSAEIVTRDKKTKVWPAGNERFVFHRDGPDVCQALRHDYFDHCYFTLPQELPPGSYTLSIQVEDVPTKRVAREALDFIVR